MSASEPPDRGAGVYPPQIDDALLERTYGDDAEPRPGDLAAASLERMRETFRAYRDAVDVEPPSRGLDALLAAAKVEAASMRAAGLKASALGSTTRAPATTATDSIDGTRRARAVPTEVAQTRPSAARPSLGERMRGWFAPMFAHPGLASAAALVVVVGVGGVLWSRGKARTVDVSASAPASVAPAAVNEAMVATGDMPTAAPAVAPVVAPVVANETEEALDVAVTAPARGDRNLDLGQGSLRETKTRQKPSAEPTDKSGAKATGSATGTSTGAFDDADGQLNGTTAVAGLAAAEDRRREIDGFAVAPAADPSPAPKPAPAPARAPEPQAAAPATTEAKPAKAPSKTATIDVRALTRQAQTAARSGDCGVVKALSDRIRRADPAYHRATFLTDPALKPCL